MEIELFEIRNHIFSRPPFRYLPKEEVDELVLRESDDYELIITCPETNVEKIQSIVSSVSRVPVTHVGRMTGDAGSIELVFSDGSRRPVPSKGWDHFTDKE